MTTLSLRSRSLERQTGNRRQHAATVSTAPSAPTVPIHHTQGIMAAGNTSLLPKFNVGMEPYSWLQRWENYSTLHKITKEDKPNWFGLFLGEGLPIRWYSGLSAAQQADYEALKKAFLDNFMESETARYKMISNFQNRKQLHSETVQQFVSELQLQAQIYKVDDKFLINCLIQNFLPHIQQDVIRLNPKTLSDIIEVARNSEA